MPVPFPNTTRGGAVRGEGPTPPPRHMRDRERAGLTGVPAAKLVLNQMRQLALELPRRGGKRPGAGRKPKGRRALVSHHRRPRFEKPAAVQVTLRVAGHVWNLRSRRCFELIEKCLAAARERFGLRVIEFTVLGNHLHLVVEAGDDGALSRGMQGLNIRIAKALNRLMKSEGRVFA